MCTCFFSQLRFSCDSTELVLLPLWAIVTVVVVSIVVVAILALVAIISVRQADIKLSKHGKPRLRASLHAEQ